MRRRCSGLPTGRTQHQLRSGGAGVLVLARDEAAVDHHVLREDIAQRRGAFEARLEVTRFIMPARLDRDSS